jgi:HJR/Mrr/RecB family endonuclease
METIEQVKRISPELVRHLQSRTDELSKLNEYVFEEIVAELLAQQKYENVELVGRNPNTSADIFAFQTINPSGIKVRLFIEVKRWKKKVGIGVINSVYGAMILEQPMFGCNAAMIVSLAGFTETYKLSKNALEMRSIYLKKNLI